MKIKTEIVQGWLDTVAEKQEDNVRFVPAVIEVNIKKKGTAEIVITDANEVFEPQKVEIATDSTVTIPGCYYRFVLDQTNSIYD